MRRLSVKRLLVALLALSAAGAFVLPVRTAHAAGPITLQAVQLYTHLNCNGTPSGPTSADNTFPNTTPTIFALATYTDWEGQHTVTFTWTAPDGSTAQTPATDTFTGTGPTYDVDYLPLAWTSNAPKVGAWKLEINIDGTVVQTVNFTVTSSTTTTHQSDFCIILPKVEKPGSKQDPFNGPAPLKTVKVKKKIQFTLYYFFSNLSPQADIKVTLTIKRSGKTVHQVKGECKKNCAQNYLGQSYDWTTYTPKQTGKYTFTGQVQVGSDKRSGSVSFTVKK